MIEKVWAIASTTSSIRELTVGARLLGESTALITTSASAGGADVIYRLSEENNSSFLFYLPTIIELVKEHSPQLILVEPTRDGRLAAGQLAAALGTSPLPESMCLEVDGEGVTSKRLVYGGNAIRTEHSPLPAVVIMGAGSFEDDGAQLSGEVVSLTPSNVESLTLLETRACSVQTVNLSAAKKIIGVGRGLGSAGNLPIVEKLSVMLGAEIGCTRPVSEEEHWFTKDRYIGVSGCMAKPAFYLAVGISGQIQHMVGVNQAGVILAVNKDENAPIFKQADFGLVGDSADMLSAIVKKLEK
ncbi:MAG: electron transfer flavoprotein subunit alpha/FixB family protein [Oscillospiraceae bacterium]